MHLKTSSPPTCSSPPPKSECDRRLLNNAAAAALCQLIPSFQARCTRGRRRTEGRGRRREPHPRVAPPLVACAANPPLKTRGSAITIFQNSCGRFDEKSCACACVEKSASCTQHCSRERRPRQADGPTPGACDWASAATTTT